MSNEWLEIAWINYVKAILHGQIVVNNREITIEQVLTEEQRETVYRLTEKHEREMARLLRSFVNEDNYSGLPEHYEL